MEVGKLVSAIEARFPEIHPTSWKSITTGWENTVLEINGDHIFRFPNFPRRWPSLQREITLLRWLAPRLTIKVPNYEFVWAGSRKQPQKLAGYRKIPGEPAQDVFRREWVDRLGKELGDLLTDLHRLRPPHDIVALVPRWTDKTWMEEEVRDHSRMRKYVYPLLDTEIRKRAETFWFRHIEYMSHVNFKPALIHRDVSGGNIVLDDSGRLYGLIDWGGAMMGDPALDFRAIFKLNRDLGEAALENYGLEKSGFRERINLYLVTVPFGDVAWGVWIGDKRAVRMGLKGIQERLA